MNKIKTEFEKTHPIHFMKKICLVLTLLCFSITTFGQMDMKQREQLFASLKNLYNASPGEGCRIFKVKKTAYLVSFVAMDNAKFESPTQMQRIAQVKSARNAGEFVNGVSTSSQTDVVVEESDGNYKSATIDKISNISKTNVKGMEMLGYFDGPDNTSVFTFVTVTPK